MNERRQDFELLQRFTRHGEQAAFADVARRHLDLVFATALRKVEDAGAAQEVAQNVFAALARKAWRFAPDDSLPAWLHKAALLESKSWLRGELGRRRREATAATLGTTMNAPEEQTAFHALVPLLDEALLSLREKDRTALLLRFYESHSLREVGAAVGVSEDAARMRVQSALEKLAEFFKRHGIKTASVAAAAAALQHTATTASATVADAVVSAVLQVAPPAITGLGLLLAQLTRWTRGKTAVLCVALVVALLFWFWRDKRRAGQGPNLQPVATQLAAKRNDTINLQTNDERITKTESSTQIPPLLPSNTSLLATNALAQPAGQVVVWGWNGNSASEKPTDSPGQTNVPAAAQSGVVAIAHGEKHCVVLKNDGSVVVWGKNTSGQTNMPVAAQSGVVAIAADHYRNLALKNDGSVVAWGSNAYSETNVPAAARSGVKATITVGFGRRKALKYDGSVVEWEDYPVGQTNVPAAAQRGVRAITVGLSHSVALKDDGSVVAWGRNNEGQTNVPAAAQSGVVAIATSGSHIVALKNDGTVVAWGDNKFGQTNVPAGLSGVTAISAIGWNTMVLRGSGLGAISGHTNSTHPKP